ncbi:MAG: hypothetical protein WBB42_04545, partial [Polyangiales bacterium]
DVTIAGDVRLDERPTAETATRPAAKPLAVWGDQLQLVGADTPEAVLTVSGQPAHVAARGMAMVGSAVNFERQSNRLWIDGAGKMTLPVDRDLQGQPLATAEPLDINWQGHMVFDGQTIRFDRDVVATTQQQRLETGQLDVTLNHRVVFGQPVDQDQIGLARIDCRHGVQLESSTLEQGRRTSWERLHTGDLAIEQASGRLEAKGPGWVSTVRPGSAANQDALSFVKVTFQRGAAGNIHQRELVFSDQVRCIYGPVAGWNAELDPAKVEGPQGDEVILTCDQLALRQMDAEPHGRRPVEMEAEGNATVEGETFTAQGHRLTYTTAKELLVLEGTGQTDARLTRQSRVGGPTSQAVAQKIQYWRLKNRVEVQNARFGSGSLDQDR